MSNITKQQFAFKVTAVWGLLLFIVLFLIDITQSRPIQDALIYSTLVTFMGMSLVLFSVYHIFLEEYKSEAEEE